MADLREALEKAYEAQETEKPAVEDSGTTPPEPESQLSSGNAPAAVPAPVGDAEPVKEETVSVATEKPKYTLPSRWTPEKRAKFDSLPDESKDLIHDVLLERERDYTQKVNALSSKEKNLAEQAQMASGFQEVLKPYSNLIASTGRQAHEVVGILLDQVATLRFGTPDAKRALLNGLASEYGVQLNAEPHEDVYVDPHVSSLQKQVQELTHYLQQQQQHTAQQYTSQQSASISSIIDQIADETDKNGNKVRVHFDKVADKPEFKAMYRVLKEANPNIDMKTLLTEAYDRTVYAYPETRDEILSMERKAVMEEIRKAQQKQVDIVRKAGATVSGSPNSAANGYTPETVRGSIEAAYDMLASRSA